MSDTDVQPTAPSPSAIEYGDPYLRIVRWINRLKAGSCIIQYRDSGVIGPLIPNEPQTLVIREMLDTAATCPRCKARIRTVDPTCPACTRETGTRVVRGEPGRFDILKGRKDGISTLIQSFSRDQCEHYEDVAALTVGHTEPSTTDIFKITLRMIYNGRVPVKRQRTVTFRSTGSTYSCRTAGGDFSGTGATNAILHNSELAKWKRASVQGKGSTAASDTEAYASLASSVPLASNTWVFNESTAMGPQGEFYKRCEKARSGAGDSKLIFIPWFLNSQNKAVVPVGFERTAEECVLAEQYHLTDEQLQWRRQKMSELAATEDDRLRMTIFKREYPSCYAEAFASLEGRVYPQYDDTSRFVRSLDLTRFRNSTDPKRIGLCRGMDEGYSGDHPFAILWIAYDNTQPPEFVVDPSCVNFRRELLSYQWDPKSDLPKKENDHGPDAARGAIVRLRLSGLVYVYRELYVFGTEQLAFDQIVRKMQELSHFRCRTGFDDSNLRNWEPTTEDYRATVVARGSGDGVVRQLKGWGIKRCTESSIPRLKGQSTGNERKDGILLVNALMSGTVQLYPTSRPPPDLDVLDNALAKQQARFNTGSGGLGGRMVALSNAERDAILLRQIREAEEAFGRDDDIDFD